MKKSLLASLGLCLLLVACEPVQLSEEPAAVATETLSFEALSADQTFAYTLNYDPALLKASDEFLVDGAHFFVTGGADIWVRTGAFDSTRALRYSEVKDECRHDYAQVASGPGALIFHMTVCLDHDEVLAGAAFQNLLDGVQIVSL